MENKEDFLDQYIATALWSSNNEDGTPLDDDVDESDLAPSTLASFKEDCEAFLADNADDIGENYSQAGHDFWLTRNHHGAGFWDGDWPAEAAKRLTEASHVYGSVCLFIGDDGLVYNT